MGQAPGTRGAPLAGAGGAQLDFGTVRALFRGMSLLLYNVLFPFLFVLYLPCFIAKLVRRGGYTREFWERFGLFTGARKRELRALDRPVWVHFDTDILRPEDAPAMNYVSEGGPSAVDLGHVFSHLANTGNVAAVSVSSWNPELDSNGTTAETCMALVDRLLGI